MGYFDENPVPSQPPPPPAPSPRSWEQEAEGVRQGATAWMQRWALLAGVGLGVGFLLPIVLPGRFGSSTTIWPWTLWDAGVPFETVASSLLPLALGIGAVLLARGLTGVGLASSLFFSAAASLVLGVLWSGANVAYGAVNAEGLLDAALAVFLMLLLGPLAVGIGVHLRGTFPDSAVAKAFAGVGGALVIAAFLLPIVGDASLVTVLSQQGAGRAVWPLLLLSLGLFGYAVGGLVGVARTAASGAWAPVMSRYGRALLVGAPAAVFVQGLVVAGSDAIGTGFLFVAKTFLLLYGPAVLLGVGTAGWIESASVPEAGGVGSWRPPSDPAGPVGGAGSARQAFRPRRGGTGAGVLSARTSAEAQLRSLDDLRSSGVLSTTEYELKRREILRRHGL